MLERSLYQGAKASSHPLSSQQAPRHMENICFVLSDALNNGTIWFLCSFLFTLVDLLLLFVCQQTEVSEIN